MAFFVSNLIFGLLSIMASDVGRSNSVFIKNGKINIGRIISKVKMGEHTCLNYGEVKWYLLLGKFTSFRIDQIPFSKYMLDRFLKRKISIQLSFSVGSLALFFIILLLLAYFGWEFYWYKKVGLYFIKWHTRIVFSALFYGLILFSPLVFIGFFNKGDTVKKAYLLVLGIWSGLIILEIGLLVLGINNTYSEERTGAYQSPFELNSQNYYHVYQPYDTIASSSPEFSFVSNYNALGYLGKDWSLNKRKPSRIIVFGDSFTEGDGAPQDSCYPAKLAEMLKDSFEVLNAGVRGSDPVFGFKNLEDRLLKYKPDIVIQAVSENDVLFDFCIRGGFERFQKDGTLKFNSPPFWEPLYALSFSVRIFFHLLDLNLSQPCGNSQNVSLVWKRNRILNEVFHRYELLGKRHHFKTYVLFYPTKFEVKKDKWFFDFSPSKKYISNLTTVDYIDVFPCYRHKMKQLNKDPMSFYWKIDGHHNASGYALMAECVAEAIQE
jgi:lysophospholipase L1-like esterase